MRERIGEFSQFRTGMRLPDISFDISEGTGGPDRRSSYSKMLIDANTALSESRGNRTAREVARGAVRSAVRDVLKARREDLPKGVGRYVIGPKASTGGLLLSDLDYSQYYVAIIFQKDPQSRGAFVESRDDLVLPTARTLAEFDADRSQVDGLVRTNTRYIEPEPVDAYSLRLAELKAIQWRRQFNSGEGTKGDALEHFLSDERVVPLASALTVFPQMEEEGIPLPQIIRQRSGRGNTVINFDLPLVHFVGWPSWVQRGSKRRVIVDNRPTQVKFSLDKLNDMANAYAAGQDTLQNEAGSAVLGAVQAAGIWN